MAPFLEKHTHIHASKKLKHVQACLLPESQYEKTTGLEHVELMSQSAAGLSLDDISLSTTFLGHKLKAPLMIAPMTGGTELGRMLNERWARAAEHFGIAFGVGSQRLALFDESARQSFLVRQQAPHAFIIANLGIAQLLKEDAVSLALRAVSMIEANALYIHLNPLQEACQQGGDRSFVGIHQALKKVCAALGKYNIPVLAREVGFGLSKEAASILIDCGISGIDCAGAGGTSWTKVESLCAQEESYKRLGAVFGEWGIPTASSIKNVRKINKTIPLVAVGGIRTGLDVAKCLALSAHVVGMAQPMLEKAIKSEDELFRFIEQIMLELKVAMLASGAQSIADLPAALAAFSDSEHRP